VTTVCVFDNANSVGASPVHHEGTLWRPPTARPENGTRIASNLAARLADEAGPRQILIAQRLYAEVEDDVEVEPVGEFTLKGFQRPVAAFNVLAIHAPVPELPHV
jgi:hypothetical protein